jgi:exopolyphosphatase/guanosine-5'-triphosphate,3'-diphosphate pyrophosphatase
MIYGAIDIGTNAARLLIGEVVKENGHSFVKKISYTRIPLRLGLEVFEDGIISPAKQKDFVKTIKAFRLLADVFKIHELRACATSAMREAINGEETRQLILDKTGVPVEIIDGEEEARLIFGTFFLLDFDKGRPFLVIDVGGGSTEISVFENGIRVASKSFKVGTIRMLKKKESITIWPEIHDWIQQHVDPKMVHKVFATGGNINKVHKLLGKQFMEPVRFRELDELHSTLNQLSLSERISRYQLKEDRADVIVPACEIYKYIMTELKAKELLVPKIGLSDGMIYDLHLQATANN